MQESHFPPDGQLETRMRYREQLKYYVYLTVNEAENDIVLHPLLR